MALNLADRVPLCKKLICKPVTIVKRHLFSDPLARLSSVPTNVSVPIVRTRRVSMDLDIDVCSGVTAGVSIAGFVLSAVLLWFTDKLGLNRTHVHAVKMIIFV